MRAKMMENFDTLRPFAKMKPDNGMAGLVDRSVAPPVATISGQRIAQKALDHIGRDGVGELGRYARGKAGQIERDQAVRLSIGIEL
jgi:hypothetical protein